MSLVNSLAGSDRKYVVGQARLKNGMLHYQFKGQAGNRAYGIAGDISLKTAMLPPSPVAGKVSLAGTTPRYITIQARPFLDDPATVNVQIADGSGNRKYGSAFRMQDTVLAAWLTREVHNAFTKPVTTLVTDEDAVRDAIAS